jgi:hypothetical protein
MTVAETAYCKAETQTYYPDGQPGRYSPSPRQGYSGTYDKAAHDAVASMTVTASGTELAASGYTVQYSTDAGEANWAGIPCPQ